MVHMVEREEELQAAIAEQRKGRTPQPTVVTAPPKRDATLSGKGFADLGPDPVIRSRGEGFQSAGGC